MKQDIAKKTGICEAKIPGSYQSIGSIILIKFPGLSSNTSLSDKKRIARALMKNMPNIVSVFENLGIGGELRKPCVRLLAGLENTRTIHKEHGIVYSIDISKAMFSKGNLFERQRILEKIRKGETVLDMFAGIGYFSLGIAKFSRVSEVIAIEKSHDSFELLQENIHINKIKNINPILGDCRNLSNEKKLQNIADRIVMGYLPGTYKYLPHAFRFLRQKGTIHYHDTFRTSELWKVPEKIIRNQAAESGYSAKIILKKKVKSFSPNVWHVVLDIKARKL